MKITLVQKPKSDRKGAQPVYVRVSHEGKERLVSLAISVEPKHWNPKRQELRATHRDHEALSALLSERLARAQKAGAEAVLSGGRNVSVDRIKEAVIKAVHPQTASPKPAPPILDWMQREVREQYWERGKVTTSKAYTSAVNNLRDSLVAQGVGVRVTASGLTLPVLLAHRNRLEAPKPPKGHPGGPGYGCGHAPNYVEKQISIVRTLLRRAMKARVDGAREAHEAALDVEVKKVSVEKPRLSYEQVMEYFEDDLTGRRADTRDWWCASFFLGGLRIGDVFLLKWDNVAGGRIKISTQKTGARANAALAPQAQTILDRWRPRTGPGGTEPSMYVFGMLAEGVEADRVELTRQLSAAKALARKYIALEREERDWPVVGGKRINLHSARHSLADHLRKEGVPVYDVSKILTQSRLSTTETYLASFDTTSVDASLLGALARPDGSGNSEV
ncbi:tyrosine-type recombinase/integrase [Rubrivirga sp. IMCC45206]|uniref:tyrosine-type recombinase/integrase n=1 Tax=Rubrivirga sp. IMCC45206 TaxID=3391614 RepID=UPI00398FB591